MGNVSQPSPIPAPSGNDDDLSIDPTSNEDHITPLPTGNNSANDDADATSNQEELVYGPKDIRRVCSGYMLSRIQLMLLAWTRRDNHIYRDELRQTLQSEMFFPTDLDDTDVHGFFRGRHRQPFPDCRQYLCAQSTAPRMDGCHPV
jgi:hypothetical protein